MKETLELITALSSVAGRAARAAADGRWTIVERVKFLSEFGAVAEGVIGISEVPQELAHMELDELAQVRAAVIKGLIEVGASHRDADAVDAIMAWLYSTVHLGVFLKNRPLAALPA